MTLTDAGPWWHFWMLMTRIIQPVWLRPALTCWSIAHHLGVFHRSHVLAGFGGRVPLPGCTLEPPCHRALSAARPHPSGSRPYGGPDGAVSGYPDGLGRCLLGRGRRESDLASRVHHGLGLLRVPPCGRLGIGSGAVTTQALSSTRHTERLRRRGTHHRAGSKERDTNARRAET